jgi:hypothetical protein
MCRAGRHGGVNLKTGITSEGADQDDFVEGGHGATVLRERLTQNTTSVEVAQTLV